MRAASMVTLAAALLFAWATASAQGRDYPFCAYGGKSSEGMRCDYSTLAQCQASTSGGGGSCVANPVGAQASPRQRDSTPAAKR